MELLSQCRSLSANSPAISGFQINGIPGGTAREKQQIQCIVQIKWNNPPPFVLLPQLHVGFGFCFRHCQLRVPALVCPSLCSGWLSTSAVQPVKMPGGTEFEAVRTSLQGGTAHQWSPRDARLARVFGRLLCHSLLLPACPFPLFIQTPFLVSRLLG